MGAFHPTAASTQQLEHVRALRNERAREMLLYYFRVLFTKTGARWDHDTEIEIGGIVDDLEALMLVDIQLAFDDLGIRSRRQARPAATAQRKGARA